MDRIGMAEAPDDDLKVLLARAAKAHEDTRRLMAELAQRQADLGQIRKAIVEASLRRAEAERLRHEDPRANHGKP